MSKGKNATRETITCPHYAWILYQRNGIYCVDGRSNNSRLGRRSLGVTTREAALPELQRLDNRMAVKNGLVLAPVEMAPSEYPIGIKEGAAIYLKHTSRPQILGGAAKSTIKRYTPIFANFEQYALKKNMPSWNQVKKLTIEDYVSELEAAGRSAGTIALEVTVLKQAFKHLAENEFIPKSSRLKVPVRRPQGTTRYCWRDVEVAAMVEYCDQRTELSWLRAIIIGLACTGLRISELLGLRWTDIKPDTGMVCLTDERTRKKTRRKLRTVKNRTGRSFPIHADFRTLLDGLSRTGNLVFLSAEGAALEYHFVRQKFVDLIIGPLAEKFPSAEGEEGFAEGRLHSFRHYFCSTCANSGVSENAVMRWLGHKDSAMVRHYYHLHDDEARRQMSGVKFLK
ncbi:MAG: site-specific integrase [Planctomycetota bacterium]